MPHRTALLEVRRADQSGRSGVGSYVSGLRHQTACSFLAATGPLADPISNQPLIDFYPRGIYQG